MSHPTGESNYGVLKLDAEPRLMLQFWGFTVTSLAYRELEDALGLAEMAIERLAVASADRNGYHGVFGLLRQSGSAVSLEVRT